MQRLMLDLRNPKCQKLLEVVEILSVHPDWWLLIVLFSPLRVDNRIEPDAASQTMTSPSQ